ncbi:MAG: hypothetical protein NC314_01660 [Roseburia sp.]|nr:hypothetical protein [Ruminococcus sp.]MCM1154779.1 hypothetical protein [Roseburia sp.]MCM1241521.1 hypothetical protein [Roseburia sp.]
MNRADFMKNLAELLADMSPAEREEAIQYYNDYFDDAGAENEQSVIASLGTPEQLAGTIKAGLFEGTSSGEFTEKGFSGYEQKKSNEVFDPNQPGQENTGNGGWQSESGNASGYYQSGSGYGGYQNQYNGRNAASDVSDKNKKKPMSAGSIILIVLLCILASPLIIGIAGGIFGIIVGILGGLFGCVVGLGAAAIALLVVGVCLFVYGIGLLFGAPLGGLCMMGAAMICLALGILFAWIVVMICGALIPAIVRGIVKLFQKIFHRGGATA